MNNEENEDCVPPHKVSCRSTTDGKQTTEACSATALY